MLMRDIPTNAGSITTDRLSEMGSGTLFSDFAVTILEGGVGPRLPISTPP